MINIFYDDKNKRHFRGKYTKVRDETVIHPHYIVGETEDKYASLGITHSKKNGNHYNHLLNNNPNKKDKEKSYMKKNIEISDKKKYTNFRYRKYKLSNEDGSYVNDRISRFQNKK